MSKCWSTPARRRWGWVAGGAPGQQGQQIPNRAVAKALGLSETIGRLIAPENGNFRPEILTNYSEESKATAQAFVFT